MKIKWLDKPQKHDYLARLEPPTTHDPGRPARPLAISEVAPLKAQPLLGIAAVFA